MGEADTVRVERIENVGRVVMDRADRHNAMTPEMADAIASGLETHANDDEVRCIVLTGAEHVYNTGADLGSLSGDESDESAIDEIAGPLHASVRTMTTAPKPVITGINGIVAGGGLGLALASDVALMAESARIEYAYPRIGLSGDGGITWLLPKLLGLRRAQSFALLGDSFDATEAVDAGLVTESVPEDEFDDRLAELASDLASGPTRACGTIRRLLFESGDRALDDHLRTERGELTGLTETEDYARGVGTFFDDAEPDFVGR